MRLLGTLAAYLAVTATLFGGLVGGVLWLVRSDPTVAHAQRSGPIPPRIAESIERKTAPPPQQFVRQPVAVKEPEPVKPVMYEAQVALTPASRNVQVRERATQTRVKRKPRRPERAIAAHTAPPQEASSASTRSVSTARSDSPY